MENIHYNYTKPSNSDSIFKWDTSRYLEQILSKIGGFEGDFFLDVGCGSGHLTERVAVEGAFCVGVDIKQHKNWRDCRSPNCEFIVCDARQLPFVDGAFDEALSKDVLHHTTRPRSILSEILRVVSGRVVVLESNRYNPIMFAHMTMLLKHNHFTQRDFTTLVRSVKSDAKFKTAEVHVLPSRPKPIIRILTVLLNLFDSKQLRTFHSYNIALLV